MANQQQGHHNGNDFFAAINYHKKSLRTFKDDMESLYYMMLEVVGMQLPWDGKISKEYLSYKMDKVLMRVSKKKNQIKIETYIQYFL